MKLEGTLRIINGMQDAGVIGPYAIGGAVGAFLFIEPGTTFDLDLFIAWETSDSGLIDLGPIYSYLQTLGCEPRREGIMVAGWEVQFIPLGTPLERAAFENAVAITIGGVPTRVLAPEYLMAISLQTGRPKDHLRLLTFQQQAKIARNRFVDILRQHGLEKKWTDFQSRYPSP